MSERTNAGASLSRYLAVLVLAVAVALALGWLPPTTGGLVPLGDGWTYTFTDLASRAPLATSDGGAEVGTPLDLPGHPSGHGDVVWLQRRLPLQLPRDATLAFDAVLGPFEVYLGTSRIAVFPDPEGLMARTPAGIPWQLIELPADAAGRLISVRIRTGYKPGGLKGTPLLGSRGALLTWAIDRDLPRLVVGFLVALLGMIGFAALVRREDYRLPIGLAVYLVTVGVYVVTYTHLKDLVIPAPVFWFLAWAIALPLNPVAALVFLDELFGSGPRGILRRLLYVHVAIAVAVFAIDVFAWHAMGHGSTELRELGFRGFGFAMNVLRLMIGVSSLVVVAVVGRRALAGDRDARIFAFGFITLFAFAVRDVLAAFGVAPYEWRSQVHVGALALAVSLAFIVQRRYAGAQRRAMRAADELAARAREKQLLLRDLHDGIGSLATNIHMLAELGQRRQERAGQALTTISELSGKALAELRAFVQTLDSAEVTWATVTAELRRFGAQLVEAQAREFSMHVAVNNGGTPDPVVCLNLLRIYREALTNALKQPRAQRIGVELSVDATRVELSVENDGIEGARDAVGIDAGRGVANLRARATELGGTLELTLGDTARLLVVIPLPRKSPDGIDAGASATG